MDQGGVLEPEADHAPLMMAMAVIMTAMLTSHAYLRFDMFR
jgi:hypothetical protein